METALYFYREIQRLSGSERQLAGAIPRWAHFAHAAPVRAELEAFARLKSEHVGYLDIIRNEFGWPTLETTCLTTRGLIDDSKQFLAGACSSAALDCYLLEAARVAAHIQVEGYRSAAEISRLMGQAQAHYLLEQCLGHELAYLWRVFDPAGDGTYQDAVAKDEDWLTRLRGVGTRQLGREGSVSDRVG